METKTLSQTQTETPTWNNNKRGAVIDIGDITLTLLNEGNNVWSLVITMNKSANHTYFDSIDLEEAKTIALIKLQKMVAKINQDMALLS